MKSAVRLNQHSSKVALATNQLGAKSLHALLAGDADCAEVAFPPCIPLFSVDSPCKVR